MIIHTQPIRRQIALKELSRNEGIYYANAFLGIFQTFQNNCEQLLLSFFFKLFNFQFLLTEAISYSILIHQKLLFRNMILKNNYGP